MCSKVSILDGDPWPILRTNYSVFFGFDNIPFNTSSLSYLPFLSDSEMLSEFEILTQCFLYFIQNRPFFTYFGILIVIVSGSFRNSLQFSLLEYMSGYIQLCSWVGYGFVGTN